MNNLPQTIEVNATPRTNHTHTVIFLHGRSDTASNFASTFHHAKTSQGLDLRQTFPSFRWVFPQANLLPSASQFGNPRVSQWFDIWNVTDFSEHEQLQASGLRDSVQRIRTILSYEVAKLGGRWNRIILAGISQGGATAVHTLMNLNLDSLMFGQEVSGPRQLGAFLGFCCRMPFPGRTLFEARSILQLPLVPVSDEVLTNTPMLLEHCIDDPVVPVESGMVLRDTLKNFGAYVTWLEYAEGGHWFNTPTGMDDVVSFLKTVVDGLRAGERTFSPERMNVTGGMGFV